MIRIAIVPLLVSGMSLVFAVPADGGDVRTVVLTAEDGSHVVHEYAPSDCLGIDPGGSEARSALGIGSVLWHNHAEFATYTTTGISVLHGSLAAATYLNPPKEVQLIPLEGTGTPDWVFPGTEFEVAASHDAEVIAAVDIDGAQSMTLYKWQAGSDEPDWSFPIPSVTPATFRTVAVSSDGSTIAVVVTVQGSPSNNARLYYFDGGSSTPLGFYDAASGTFARNLSITENGDYIAFFAGANVYVVERDTDALRYSTSAGATNDALSISGDGEFLAYGWSSLYLRQWNGSNYTLRWTRPGGGSVLRSCALSADNSTLATAWAPASFLQNKVELHELPSSTPLWTHNYDLGSGSNQDVVSDLAITADGSHVAAASWGDEGNTNGEIHVFEHATSTPVFTVDTPGSMFDVDIAAAPEDCAVYVSACGKHIHANDTGHGGDLYSIRMELAHPLDLTGDGAVDAADLAVLLGAWGPNPGHPADFNENDQVDAADLAALLGAWGPCP